MTPLKTALVVSGLAIGVVLPTLFQRNTRLRLRAENESLSTQLAEARATDAQLRAGQTAVEEQLARLRKEHSELLKLRDEVTRFRSARRDETRPEASRHETDDQAILNQQVTIEAKFAKVPAPFLKKLSSETVGIDFSGVGIAAILTDPQSRVLVRAFEEQAGADILGAPRVTTLNHRQASVEVAAVGDSDPGNPKLGPSLDVMPVVSADRLTISLQTTARLTELAANPNNPGGEGKQLLHTAVSGNAILKDGQTAVLCQWVGHSDIGSSTSVVDTNCLVVLVTPTLIDPAGNRIHPAEEIATKDITTEIDQPTEAEPHSPIDMSLVPQDRASRSR